MVPTVLKWSLVLLVLASAPAAGDAVRFDRIGHNEGLTRRAIYGVAQDGPGFMWFATEHGLYRFDGNDFTVHIHMPDNPGSISDNLVTGLCSDGDGNVWIGTQTGFIDRIDVESGAITHYRIPAGDQGGSIDRAVKNLAFGNSGILWVVTAGGGLFRLAPGAKTLEQVVSGPTDAIYLQDLRILNFFEDRAGRLWLSTENGGVVRIDFAQREFRRIGLRGPVRDPGDAVILEDASGRVWIGSWGFGLLQYDEKTDSLRPPRLRDAADHLRRATHIKSLCEDAFGNLWIGTATAGLLRLDPARSRLDAYLSDPADANTLSSNNILVLFSDRTDTLWIGTLEGLSKYNRHKFKFDHISAAAGPRADATNYIFAIHEDRRGDLWLGMRSGGAARIAADGTTRTYPLTAAGGLTVENEVLSFAEDQAGELYAGTSDLGLFRFDRTADRFRQISKAQHVSDIIVDREGVLWIATFVNGIGVFDRAAGRFNYWLPRLADNTRASFDANVIFEDDRGNLWIGSDGRGLLKMFPDRSTYSHYVGPENGRFSLSDDRVLSLAQGKDGSLWIGTRNGLNRMDIDTGSVTQFLDKNLLPDTTIYGILIDDAGMLWLSTNKGLCRFDAAASTSRTYDWRDGIPEYEFNLGAYARGNSGSFYFAGGNECVFFRPDALRDNPHKPQVVITELHKFGQVMNFDRPVHRVSRIEFPWYENTFTIGYSSLDYAESARNQYAYKLEGFNENWIPSGGRRFANFVHVPPGEYTFQVRGTNNDGLWSESVATMRVVVIPPFWQTWPFITLMAVLGVAAVVTVYKLRTNSIKRQRNILQREVTERREAELKLIENQRRLRSLASELTLAEERERRRIAQMLHDRVGHALLLAKMKLQTGAAGNGGAEGFRAEMLDLVDGVIDDTHDLTVEISPPVLYQFGFEAAAENFIEGFEQEYGIKTIIQNSGKSPISDEVAVLLYQALRELMVNIVKHARADMVKISLSNDGERIKVVIKDNGVGMDLDAVRIGAEGAKGFGLFSIRERLEPLGGNLTIFSRPGKGTEVTMTAPLKHAGGTR